MFNSKELNKYIRETQVKPTRNCSKQQTLEPIHQNIQRNNAVQTAWLVEYYFIMKTHVRGFFDTDLHEVSWHFATHEAVRPSGF